MTSNTVNQDPLTRLSLAVRQLDKLIDRANQLAHLSELPLPPDPDPANQTDQSDKSNQCTPGQSV